MTQLQLGHLVSASRLRLHTYKAQSLVDGKVIANNDESAGTSKFNIPSIIEVGHLLNALWACAKSDDPYADLVLLDIERLIDRANELLTRAHDNVSKRVKKMKLPDEFTLAIGAAQHSSELLLDHPAFRSTHCKQLLLLIARFDHFMRTLFTYQEFGFITAKKATAYERGTKRAIRGAMMAACRFHMTGVTRRDLTEENNAVANLAKRKMGVLPKDILDRTRQPKWCSGVIQSLH